MKKALTNVDCDGKDTKKIIDGDNMKLIKTFNIANTDKELEYYRSLGRWDDVSVDHDGDIILWQE